VEPGRAKSRNPARGHLLVAGGGALVLGAVLWVQAWRPDLDAELAPPFGEAR
jgi:type II secretory pathway component PulM